MQSRALIDTSYFDKDFLARLRARCTYVEVGEYRGDWNLGAGKFFIAFDPYREEGGVVQGGEFIVLHTFSNNNPVGSDPLKMEGIYFHIDYRHELVALRDMLNEILKQD
jgi:hypothetical protein